MPRFGLFEGAIGTLILGNRRAVLALSQERPRMLELEIDQTLLVDAAPFI